LRTQAAGLQKDAEDYDIVISQLNDKLKQRRNRLRTLADRKKELTEKLMEVRKRQSRLPKEEAKNVQAVVDDYRNEKETMSAQMAGVEYSARALRRQIQHLKDLQNMYLERARESRRQATRLEERADELEETSPGTAPSAD
jgi:chromosome segregation ATPase